MHCSLHGLSTGQVLFSPSYLYLAAVLTVPGAWQQDPTPHAYMRYWRFSKIQPYCNWVVALPQALQHDATSRATLRPYCAAQCTAITFISLSLSCVCVTACRTSRNSRPTLSCFRSTASLVLSRAKATLNSTLGPSFSRASHTRAAVCSTSPWTALGGYHSNAGDSGCLCQIFSDTASQQIHGFPEVS